MNAYNVLRFKKLKSFGQIGAAASHNLRKRPTPNADPSRPNIDIKHIGDGGVEAVKSAIGEQTIRKNAVLAVEVVISASPEYFRPNAPALAGLWDENRLEAWRVEVEPWIKKNFPHAVSVRLHLDEATPHYQIIDVPLDAKGKLNCRGKFGGAETLRQWQTSIANVTKKLGIKRGLEGSRAQHIDIKQFYAAANKPSPVLPSVETPKPHQLPEPTFSDSFGAAKKKRQELEKEHETQKRQRQKELSARSAVAIKLVEQFSDKANSADIAQREAKDAKATADKLTKEKVLLKADADKIKALPIEDVLNRIYGARSDDDTESKHKTQVYRLPSNEKIMVTEDLWFDKNASKGGKGAINLIIHLESFQQHGLRKALRILAEHFESAAISAQRTRDIHEHVKAEVKLASKEPLPLPEVSERHWSQVKNWLEMVCGLPARLTKHLKDLGLIYADYRANAVFKRSDNAAFLYGTGDVAFKRNFGGKEHGAFIIKGASEDCYIVDDPLDALAVKAIHKDATVVDCGANLIPMRELSLPINVDRVFAAFGRDAHGIKLAKEAEECFGAERFAPSVKIGTVKHWADAVLKEPEWIDSRWLPEVDFPLAKSPAPNPRW